MSFSFKNTATSTAGTGGGGGFSFGGLSTANKPMGMAQPNAASNTTFGTSTGFGTPASAGGLSFGQTSITPVMSNPTANSTGLGTNTSMGGTSAFGGGFGGGFGTSTASTAPNTGFGGLSGGFGTTATTSALGAGVSFGPVKTTVPAFNSSTLASSSLAFGQPSTTPATGFGGLGTASTALTQASPSLGFGQTTPASSANTMGGFGSGLGAPAPAFGGASSGFGALGSTSLTTASTGLGGSVAPAPFTGLGGAPNALAGTANSANDNKNGSKTAKENHIPNELAQTVEEFKKFTKEERSVSSDIAHTSSKIHQKIKAETDGLMNLVKVLSAGLAKNKVQLDRIKLDAAQEILNVEIAQRTKDTPPTLQFENTAPYDYFSRLVSRFENQMLAYRRQISETEHHLLTLTEQHSITPSDISLAIQKLHASFTALAGKYQKLHEAVLAQKDSFIHQHRQKHGLSSINLFPQRQVSSVGSAEKIPTTVGPSAFSGQKDLMTLARNTLNATSHPQQGNAPPTFGLGTQPGAFNSFNNPSGGGLGTPSGTMGSGLFSNQNTLGVSSANTSTPGLFGNTMSPFGNMSSLGAGNKRGKH